MRKKNYVCSYLCLKGEGNNTINYQTGYKIREASFESEAFANVYKELKKEHPNHYVEGIWPTCLEEIGFREIAKLQPSVDLSLELASMIKENLESNEVWNTELDNDVNKPFSWYVNSLIKELKELKQMVEPKKMIKMTQNKSWDHLGSRFKPIPLQKFADTQDLSQWEKCPDCNEYPRLWIFDNGEHADCACDPFSWRNTSEFSVYTRGIGFYIQRDNGSNINYDSTLLRRTWNDKQRNKLDKENG